MPYTPEQLAAAERIRQRINPTEPLDWLAHLHNNGRAMWDVSYRHTSDDRQALERIARYAYELPDHNPRKAVMLDYLALPTTATDLLASALWVESACPRVSTSHRFAAACVCTTIPDDYDLRQPWRCWMLDLPDSVLIVTDPETSRETWIRYALVYQLQTEHGPRWSILGMCDASRLQIGVRGVDTQQLISDFTGDDDAESALEWDIDDTTERAISCLKRLVVNVLVAMTGDPDHPPAALGKHAPGWTRGPSPTGAPQHRMFMVARPTTIDVRAAVTEYCRGGRRRTPTVASLAKGHWRNVAYGPRFSLHYRRFIEPYWIGPRDGLVVSPRVRVE